MALTIPRKGPARLHRNAAMASHTYFQKRRTPWIKSFLQASSPLSDIPPKALASLHKGLPLYISQILPPADCAALAEAVSNKQWVETLLSMKTKEGKTIKHFHVDISSDNDPFLSGFSEKITKKLQDIFFKFEAQNFPAIFRESGNVFFKNDKDDERHGEIHFDNSVNDKSYEDVWEDRHLFTLWMPLEVPLPFYWVLPNFKKETIIQREVSVGDGILLSQTYCEHAGPLSKTIRLALSFNSKLSEEYTEKRKREEETEEEKY